MTDLNSAQKYFENLVTGPVMVAFSGGTDSILVLKLALHAAQGKFPVYALYADTPWMPRRALKEARDIAREFQIDLNVITIDRPEDIGIENNPKDRCYRCKKAIFKAFFAFGNEHGTKLLLEGTQLDDLTKYRPGLKATWLEICHAGFRGFSLRKYGLTSRGQEKIRLLTLQKRYTSTIPINN